MMAKICLMGDFGLLNPNLAFIFVHRFSISSIANFSVSGGPEIGNTVAVGENQWQTRIQRPTIIILTNFCPHNYPKTLIFLIHRRVNYRMSTLGIPKKLILFLDST